MSVRAIAVRSGPRVMSARAARGGSPIPGLPRARRHVRAAPGAAWARFTDDRRLVRLKLLVLGLLALAAMALEVPL